MANTKKLPRAERKRAKRAGRKAYHELVASLTRKQRSEHRKSGKSLKVFLAEASKSSE
jgi:hypothetical protein